MTAFTHIRTTDGTIIVRDPSTGLAASGASLFEAYAEVRRLLTAQGSAVEWTSCPLAPSLSHERSAA